MEIRGSPVELKAVGTSVYANRGLEPVFCETLCNRSRRPYHAGLPGAGQLISARLIHFKSSAGIVLNPIV